jgi:hypothetical protein
MDYTGKDKGDERVEGATDDVDGSPGGTRSVVSDERNDRWKFYISKKNWRKWMSELNDVVKVQQYPKTQ